MSESVSDLINITSWEHNWTANFLRKLEKHQIDKTVSELEVKCLWKMWRKYNHSEMLEGSVCNPIWDGVYCWPPTTPGTGVTRLCSEILQETFPEHSIHLEGSVTRNCSKNGTWEPENKMDYSICSDAYEAYFIDKSEDDVLVSLVQHMLFFGSIFSLVCLGASLAIFYHFRCLWCTRVSVHVHLMLSLVFRFLLMFIIAEPFVLGRENTYRDEDALCISILVLYLYTTVASVGWMFVQGLYLNVTLMTNMINIDSRYHFAIYCFIGWGVPVIVIIAYVVVMIPKKQGECWEGYAEMKEIWIVMGPIACEVVTNGVFLLNVLRILLRKIRSSNSQSDVSQIKAAAKATAVLFPVLGINNLLLMRNPGGMYHELFVTLNTFFGSTQGIFVAFVCCFFDNDVKGAIRRAWNRANARRDFYRENGNVERCTRNEIPIEERVSIFPTCEPNDKSLSVSTEVTL